MGIEGTEGGLLAQWVWAEAGAAGAPWEDPQELAAPSWLCDWLECGHGEGLLLVCFLIWEIGTGCSPPPQLLQDAVGHSRWTGLAQGPGVARVALGTPSQGGWGLFCPPVAAQPSLRPGHMAVGFGLQQKRLIRGHQGSAWTVPLEHGRRCDDQGHLAESLAVGGAAAFPIRSLPAS